MARFDDEPTAPSPGFEQPWEGSRRRGRRLMIGGATAALIGLPIALLHESPQDMTNPQAEVDTLQIITGIVGVSGLAFTGLGLAITRVLGRPPESDRQLPPTHL